MRSKDRLLIALTVATLAAVLPFMAFLVFTIVTPDTPAASARNAAPTDRSVAASRPAPGVVAPTPEANRKRRT